MTQNDKGKQFKGLSIVALIWLAGAACDRIWFAVDHSIPAWDQADYLTGTLNYWYALQNVRWFDGEWWTSFWQLSSKIPPFTYIAAGMIQNIFGTGPDIATLVNLFFSAILLASVYGLGVELFSVEVGLWAASFCQLLPGLYRFRLDFLLDYPLTAIVTLSFYCLTVLYLNKKDNQERELKFETSPNSNIKSNRWLWAAAFGFSLGLALMVKQTALFFLLTPLLWVVFGEIQNFIKNLRLKIKKENSNLINSVIRLLQLATALVLSVLMFGPWYRTNWLLILTSGKRATIDSAIAEGDPALNTLDAWIFYWKDLPFVVSWPLLLVPIVGLILYLGKQPKSLEKSLPSLKWITIFWLGAYLLCSLNINKDTRYVMPYLPVFSLFLSYGFTLWKNRWADRVRWGTIALAIVLMFFNLYPLGGSWLTQFLSPRFQHYAYSGTEWPHRQVIAEIIKTEPYLRSNLGVLPSTPQLNQHNLNYYGALSNFQVYGRQVGTRKKFVPQDARSLSWFVTKTGDQGSIPSEAQTAIVQIVEQGGNFQVHKTWNLPDGSNLNLYHRRTPSVTVKSLNKSATKIKLNRVTVPDRVPPGFPVPVSYIWSGSWQQLQSGLVLLTWRHSGVTGEQLTDRYRWLHDHAISMGNLYKRTSSENQTLEVIERTAMLPPADVVPGIYTLEVTYLDRKTGKSYPIPVPPVKLIIDSNAKAIPSPELDLVTQFRTLAAGLPQGPKGLTPIFDQTGRINQYDPVQDYLVQAGQSLNYRLQKEPKNLEWAYAFALTKVLRRKVDGAIAALQKVTQLDPKNPYAYAYLAFVYLYDWHPKAAENALKPALVLNSNLPELRLLSGAAALMQGNFLKAWHQIQPLIVNK